MNGAARPQSCRAGGDELSEALCQQNEPAWGFKMEMCAKKSWPKARRERSLRQNSVNPEGGQY